MNVKRTHPHTGEENTLKIKVTQLELQLLEAGDHIPHLSEDEVIFITEGLLPGESDDYRGSEDYYDN